MFFLVTVHEPHRMCFFSWDSWGDKQKKTSETPVEPLLSCPKEPMRRTKTSAIGRLGEGVLEILGAGPQEALNKSETDYRDAHRFLAPHKRCCSKQDPENGWGPSALKMVGVLVPLKPTKRRSTTEAMPPPG